MERNSNDRRRASLLRRPASDGAPTGASGSGLANAADLQPALARLLRHLREQGAFATPCPIRPDRVSLYRTVRGASLGAGHLPRAVADELVATGAAAWSGSGRARRLTAMREAEPSTEAGPAPPVADGRESPLLWLHRRRGRDGQPQIPAAEFAAGERLRADLTFAQMLPRVSMNWDAAGAPRDARAGGAGLDPTEAALAARQRVDAACRRLGPELSGLAIDICGFLKPLETVERERGWPARSAKVALRLALAVLVDHYGLGEAAVAEGRTRGWRSVDARPGFPPPVAG